MQHANVAHDPTDAAHVADMCPVDLEAWRRRFIGVTPGGLAFFWREAGELVRFPYVDPREDFEAFAYCVLCECVPFFSEADFILAFGSYGRAAVQLKLIDTIDKLNEQVLLPCTCVAPAHLASLPRVCRRKEKSVGHVLRVRLYTCKHHASSPSPSFTCRLRAIASTCSLAILSPTTSSIRWRMLS